MARISNKVKATYERLDAEDSNCFYCGATSCMDDLTPHPRASESDQTMFGQKRTIVRVCRACWGKIFSANIQSGGTKFNVPLGCMTMEQKRQLLGKDQEHSMIARAFVRTHDGELVIPVTAQKIEETGDWIIDGKTVYSEEMKALQGAFLLKMFEYQSEYVEGAFQGALATGAIEIEREGLFREILELEWPE